LRQVQVFTLIQKKKSALVSVSQRPFGFQKETHPGKLISG
jgi:hypothetical protein